MAVTMVPAILGASVDTGVLPPIVHAMIAYGAIACNLAAVKIEIDALIDSARIVDEVNRRSARDAPPSSSSPASSKDYGGLRPLRIERLTVAAGEQVALLGLDQPTAEVFVNLVDRRVAARSRRGAAVRPPDGRDRRQRRLAGRRRPLRDRQRSRRPARRADRAPESRGAVHARHRAAARRRSRRGPRRSRARWASPTVAGAAGRRARRGGARCASASRRALALDPAVLLLEHPTAGLPRRRRWSAGRRSGRSRAAAACAGRAHSRRARSPPRSPARPDTRAGDRPADGARGAAGSAASFAVLSGLPTSARM